MATLLFILFCLPLVVLLAGGYLHDHYRTVSKWQGHKSPLYKEMRKR